MLSNEIAKLEQENLMLKEQIRTIQEKIGRGEAQKPKSCRFCKNYIQHYMRQKSGSYAEVYDGHCISGVPVSKGGKKKPVPDDICPYFELGAQRI